MRHRLLRVSLACGLAGLGPAAAFAQQAPAQADQVESVSKLPAEIRHALGELSDRGGPFASGCTSLHGEPHSRFSAARLGPDTAQVIVERGGIAHFYDTLEFRKVDGHWIAQPPARTAPRAG